MRLQDRTKEKIILSLNMPTLYECNKKIRDYQEQCDFESVYDLLDYTSLSGKYYAFPEDGRFILSPITYSGGDALREDPAVRGIEGKFVLPETYNELKNALKWKRGFQERIIKARPSRYSYSWFLKTFGKPNCSSSEGIDLKLSLRKEGFFRERELYLEKP